MNSKYIDNVHENFNAAWSVYAAIFERTNIVDIALMYVTRSLYKFKDKILNILF